MIGYNNQGIKVLPYNAPISLYDIKYALHKTWGQPLVAHLLNAARAIFGPPGFFKWEGLVTGCFIGRSL